MSKTKRTWEVIFLLIFRAYSFIVGKFVLLLLGLPKNRFRSDLSDHTHFTQLIFKDTLKLTLLSKLDLLLIRLN